MRFEIHDSIHIDPCDIVSTCDPHELIQLASLALRRLSTEQIELTPERRAQLKYLVKALGEPDAE